MSPLAALWHREWRGNSLALLGVIAASEGDAETLGNVHDALRVDYADVDRVERFMALAWERCIDQAVDERTRHLR